MKKLIIVVAVLAVLVYSGGYALSQSLNDGNTENYQGGRLSGMMGPGMMHGMMGSGMMGYQGETPINPETGQPFTQEELTQSIQQMHNTCGALMGFNGGNES